MFDILVSLVPLVVRGTVSFFEAGELLAHLHLAFKNSSEVPSGEETVVGNEMVGCGRLVVVQVGEAGSVGMTKDEGHEGVSVVDSIQFLTFHELLNVLFHNWDLSSNSGLGSGSVNTDAITESKNVFESLVLESVWVNIDNTFTGSNTRLKKLLVGSGGRVDACGEEILFNDLASVNASEGGDLLAVLVGLD